MVVSGAIIAHVETNDGYAWSVVADSGIGTDAGTVTSIDRESFTVTEINRDVYGDYSNRRIRIGFDNKRTKLASTDGE